MKHFFTFLLISIIPALVASQCSDLFISEYVEGSSNNKALEIYNPTANTVDLSAYSIARYTNGSMQESTPQQLTGTIEPYSTFVIGLDKRDPNGEGYDAPMWDGNYSFIEDTLCTNFGEEITIYNPESDLQSLIDFWSNGVYYSGTDPDSAAMYPQTMFFNGNDAIVLSAIGAGLVDVIGKVGEDPGLAWTDSEGNYWTQDHSLVRKPSVQNGFADNPENFDPTLEWDSLPANTFVNLGTHNCTCDPSYSGAVDNIYGCTDTTANNYDSTATLNDGSCDYDYPDPCENSVSLIENKTGILVYPNPVNNNLINIENDIIIKTIKIYNNVGKIIVNKIVDNKQIVTIDNLNTTGIYFLSIEDSNGITTKSIVVK